MFKSYVIDPRILHMFLLMLIALVSSMLLLFVIYLPETTTTFFSYALILFFVSYASIISLIALLSMFYVETIRHFYESSERNKRNFKIIVSSIIVITLLPIIAHYIGVPQTIGAILLIIVGLAINFIVGLIKSKKKINNSKIKQN